NRAARRWSSTSPTSRQAHAAPSSSPADASRPPRSTSAAHQSDGTPTATASSTGPRRTSRNAAAATPNPPASPSEPPERINPMPTKITDRVLSWATDLEDNTIEQARKSSELPFIFKHVALMPDAHLGYGATV